MKKSGFLLNGLVFLLSLQLIFPIGVVSAATAKAEIKHEQPGDSYIPGFRINLDAKVKDAAGILTARCYFKAKDDKNFGFVKMTTAGDGDYKAVLPAPFVGSEKVQYLFVSVNKAKQVTRTEIFTLQEAETPEGVKWKDVNEVKEVRLDKIQDTAEKFALLYNKSKGSYINDIAGYQSATAKGTLQVGTELPTSDVPLNGFYDTVSIEEVPAVAKYGLAAEGLYSADAVAKAGGAGMSGAASAGTTTAAIGGISWTTGLIGLAVVGGGAAAVAASSSSDSDEGGSSGGGSTGGGSTGGGSTGGLTEADLVGTWEITGSSSQWHTRTPYTLLASGTWSGQASAQPIYQNVFGTWSFDEGSQALTLTESSAGYSATFSSATISGTASSFTALGNLPAIPYTNNSGQSFASGEQDTFTFVKQ